MSAVSFFRIVLPAVPVYNGRIERIVAVSDSGEVIMEYGFFAGSYGDSQEENIVRFSLDAQTGKVTRIYGCGGIENPSWLTLHPCGRILYAVEELNPEGTVRTFEIGEQGLKPLSSLSARGADPCHISLDRTTEHLFVANYTSGSLLVCRLDGKGIPLLATDHILHERNRADADMGTDITLIWQEAGTNPIRQEGPHIHFSEIIGSQAFVVDLGLDKVCLYDWDSGKGVLKETGRGLDFPAGAGPRHLAAHPRIPELLYVVCELGSKVAVFRKQEDAYIPVKALSTLPDTYMGENTAAAIQIHEDLLLVSNRGHDSVALYSLSEDGIPTLEQIAPTGGRTPRDFQILGEYLVAANQDSDTITVLHIDTKAKRLEQTGISVPMQRPTCICPICMPLA